MTTTPEDTQDLPPAPVAEVLSTGPVAWMDEEGCLHTTEESAYFRGDPVTPLYTHPQPAVPHGFAIEKRGYELRVELLPGTERGHASCWLAPDGQFQDKILYWLAHDLLSSAPAKPAVPGVDALAEFLESNGFLGYSFGLKEKPQAARDLSIRICNWIEEQK